MILKDKHLLAIPSYNCAKQIPRLFKELMPFIDEWDEIWFVDNASIDGTDKKIIECVSGLNQNIRKRIKIYVNSENVGLGGTHKLIFKNALRLNIESITILHGDNQANPHDASKALSIYKTNNKSFILGSRFMADSLRKNYSVARLVFNRTMNQLFSVRLKFKVEDLGSGINIFPVKSLESLDLNLFPNDLTFNIEFLKWIVMEGSRIIWFPMEWRDEDQVSNVRLINQTLKTFRLLGVPLGKNGQQLLSNVEQRCI